MRGGGDMTNFRRVSIESSRAKSSGNGKIVFSIIFTALIVLIAGMYFFDMSPKAICSDQACFDERLKSCEKTIFVGGSGEVVYRYEIEGSLGNSCLVSVELLQGQLTEEDSKFLEGKKMDCRIPLGEVISPESNMKNCHGILKEDLQEIIIESLHAYVVRNIDKINEEINKSESQ